MSESMEKKLSQAMAELSAVQEAVAQAESELSQASATTRSRDRAVEVTVGPQGELTALKFPDNRHQNMTGPQLAASVLEAVQEGRAQMARRVMDVFEPLTRSSGGPTGLRGVDIDWDRAFGSALDGTDGGRRRSAARLHDEIHED
ncbi:MULTISPECIES: YbaB/EbfC family nucleoid-associated protein [Streptomyces]|uniref:YbaB/EbfC family nucleoid-associated protein n=1 Tax=Streptomyces silvae TaxID=2803812 RepID=A0ABU8A945_9ACTN|nr:MULTISPECIES: YbaB/EbfC family nucleoid-associated protein [unclassified Streptomyces]MDX3329530.1 YbaB/EbfC family nucleoid-associated protein [Streptomyces sp. ME02-6979-3A]MDX3683559.1 YbaB/EbfC family nucleoid-associated protein [Streptomyces sp. AK04-4c]WSS64762.1 YbaB/EbfC family nucleoid-associated protein [Streptomyces sp. NBC_01177]WSS78768.1 YbaB/EbfC family nucleoid-associated protein [Streptomyces sp. NBC_01174]